MRSKDILKNALQKYNGTVIVVSHDREFLDGLVDKVYEFRDGRVKETSGRHLRLPARPPAGIDARTRPGQFVRCGSRPEFRTGNESGSWQQKQRYCGQVPRERSNLTGETCPVGQRALHAQTRSGQTTAQSRTRRGASRRTDHGARKTDRRDGQTDGRPRCPRYRPERRHPLRPVQRTERPTFQTDLPLGRAEHRIGKTHRKRWPSSNKPATKRLYTPKQHKRRFYNITAQTRKAGRILPNGVPPH